MKVLDLAKENGVVMLSFPPHTSHKVQPLDRSVYGTFKKFVNNAADAWLRSNHGKTMTIYDIPFIVSQSVPNALAPKNIKSGFIVTGIRPFNSNIFTDENFLPSAVTDRPCEGNEQKITVLEVLASNSGVSSHSSTSSLNAGPSTSEGNDHHVSPVDIRDFPKAGARKETRKRKSSLSAIITDTPVKAALESEVRARRKPVKRQMLFGGSQEKSRNCKHLRRGVRRNGSSEEKDDGECFYIEYAEPYPEYRAPTKRFQCIVINGPTIAVPDSAIFMFVRIAILIIKVMNLFLNTDVMVAV